MNFLINETQTLQWVGRILSLAIIQQSIEFIHLRECVSPNGVWSWAVVQSDFVDFPKRIRSGLNWILGSSAFQAVTILNLLLGCISLISPDPVFYLVLWATHILVCLRWRGTFNGGSDFMTLIGLLAVGLGLSFKYQPFISRVALGYLALQSLSSYFVAGVVKLKSPSWRSGQAIRIFLESSVYGAPRGWQGLFSRPWALGFLAWTLLLFECTFPLVLIGPALCGVYLGLAFAFHLANAYFLGLNRFVLVWAATYPAIVYLMEMIQL